jgi:E3 ubiquitin-protein ligase DOA10
MILIQILREITMAPSLAQLSRLSPKSALTAAATVLAGAGFYVFIIFQRMR